ncbi:MAG: hypothetical protein K2M91_00325, partial [Lachnospiraceae bacterium]|nr:hypothetical protein [Lachnospiraceae bacterium]
DDMLLVKADVQELKDDMLLVKADVQKLKLNDELVIIPRLNTIEKSYLDTYNRYRTDAEKMEQTMFDTEVLKQVVEKHSEMLQKMA